MLLLQRLLMLLLLLNCSVVLLVLVVRAEEGGGEAGPPAARGEVPSALQQLRHLLGLTHPLHLVEREARAVAAPQPRGVGATRTGRGARHGAARRGGAAHPYRCSERRCGLRRSRQMHKARKRKMMTMSRKVQMAS